MKGGGEQRRVIIVGGGFGGLSAASALSKEPVDIELIDRRNHHLFQPLLYQVASAVLAPADISMPIRGVLRSQKNVRVRLGEVAGVDLAAREVVLGDGQRRPYDWLILAAGATHSYFGQDHWAAVAPGLKTLDDALEIRRRVFMAYERAEWCRDAGERRRLLSFVVVGGGPTGVELAGSLAEIARRTLVEDFRNIDPTEACVMLLEGGDTILRGYPEGLRLKALDQLAALGVEVRFGARVVDVDAGGVLLQDDGDGTRVRASTVIWAAGVAASPLGAGLGTDRDRAGRVQVSADLSLPDHPDVFVIGDMAHIAGADGEPLPGVAQVAIQGGAHVGRCIQADLSDDARDSFRYKDLGSMATIGRSKAVAWIGRVRLAGFAAWWIWLVVHLMALVGFRNRVVVLMEWAWSYMTWQRGSRLIRATQDTPDDEVRPG